MPYCENCGKEVSSSSKFCGRCGSPVNVDTQATTVDSPKAVSAAPQPAPSVSPQTQTKSTSEPVLGVLMLRKPKSLGRYDSFSGVLTGQRLIFAQMTGDMLKDAIKQSREQAKSEGKGFFGQWAEQLKASASFAQRYYSMEPSVVLAETPGNSAVQNSSVNEVKLKLKDTGTQNNTREFEIEIKSSSGKYKFRMDENNDYVQMLKTVYGDRVKTPFGYFSKGGMKFSIG
ncbi:MAG: zinc ribbon domain-containing protein [Candidatus Bathyarchaeota archaeon]|nr:zinc ribbon domain-containing protein [Candidatus Bathyarchaeum sp.]